MVIKNWKFPPFQYPVLGLTTSMKEVKASWLLVDISQVGLERFGICISSRSKDSSRSFLKTRCLSILKIPGKPRRNILDFLLKMRMFLKNSSMVDVVLLKVSDEISEGLLLCRKLLRKRTNKSDAPGKPTVRQKNPPNCRCLFSCWYIYDKYAFLIFKT